MTLFWSGGSIYSLTRNLYLLIFPGDNVDILAASLLISFCSFLFLILSWIFMINFYILSKIFFLKREGLFDARIISIAKKQYSFSVHFL